MKKRVKSKALLKAEALHRAFLLKMGIQKRPKQHRPLDLEAFQPSKNLVPTSDRIPGGVTPKRDIATDHKWKKSAAEKPETVKAIQKKMTQIAPLWNKGAVQFITPGEDPKVLGRKV